MPKSKAQAARELQAVLRQKLDDGDRQAARELIGQILELFPLSAKHWALMALLHYEDGDVAECISAANKTLHIDEDNQYALLLLAKCHDNADNGKEAIEYYRRFAVLNKSDWAYTILANAEVKEDPQRAIEDAEKALQVNPDWDEASEVLAKALKALTAK